MFKVIDTFAVYLLLKLVEIGIQKEERSNPFIVHDGTEWYIHSRKALYYRFNAISIALNKSYCVALIEKKKGL